MRELIECSAEQLEPPPVESTGKIAIIIDDIGHSLKLGRNAINLPGNITYAVIPFTPFGERLANLAHQNKKEIMLHAPMSALKYEVPKEGGLTPQLSRKDFRAMFRASLAHVPHVRGVNNHMGSELTQLRKQMAWVMQDLRQRDLYFVDSRTSEKTVAARVATEFNVPNLSRNIFLDNEKDHEAIHNRFEETVSMAQKRGFAVAIGHPYRETIQYLQEALPGMAERGLELVFVSQALTPSGKETNTACSPRLDSKDSSATGQTPDKEKNTILDSIDEVLQQIELQHRPLEY